MSHSRPELPEVEITRRGIEPFVLGKTITGVAVRNPNLRRRMPRNFARLVVGRLVKRLVRRGELPALGLVPAAALLALVSVGAPPRVCPPPAPPPAPSPRFPFPRPPP